MVGICKTLSWNRMGRIAAALAVIAVPLFIGASGCGKSDDGLSKEQKQTGDRLGQIAEKSGGDWDKLAPEDRKFLLGLSYNSEQSARMLLMNRAKTSATPPGGRPTGGPPGRTR